MEKRAFGKLGEISCLTLGGGGIGQVWGPTSRDEAVATLREAVEAGITFLDVAPAYGRGEAELVVGAAFDGRLPDGVRISTKCMLGNPPREEVVLRLERSLDRSLERTKLKKFDLFFLHGQIVPDAIPGSAQGTPRSLFVEVVRPALEQFVAQGRVSAWGVSGIGVPTAILETINENPPPGAVQVVANLLDSVGGMKLFDEPARPREIIAAAGRRGIAVMGIRAVQAGALTDSLDRELAETHPEMVDYRRAAPFRALAKEVGESAAALAHRYALSIPGVATVVLGVKNRAELRECLAAAERGPLDPELIARIDAAVDRV
ncbi:MAG TPA: aldo/keto reductase [Candidatus Binataceae bacterium]|nr:aldo/keto reductase [Candidatus Binataceae bacterium]